MIRIVVTLVQTATSEHRTRELARAYLYELPERRESAHSDYGVWAEERENEAASTPTWESRGMIGGQARRQSVWTLVWSAAKWAAEQAEARSRG